MKSISRQPASHRIFLNLAVLTSAITSEIKDKLRPIKRIVTIFTFLRNNPSCSPTVRFVCSSINGLTYIGPHSSIINSSISGSVDIGEYSCIANCAFNGTLSIGNFTSINGPSTIFRSKVTNIKVGSFVSIGPGTQIYENSHHTNRLTTYNIYKNLSHYSPDSFGSLDSEISRENLSKGPITIGNDVWIGANSIILSGVTIGTGSIVGANSTVTSDIPPYAIYAGSPARCIGYRYSAEVISHLLQTQWWNYDSIENLVKMRDMFCLSENALSHVIKNQSNSTGYPGEP